MWLKYDHNSDLWSYNVIKILSFFQPHSPSAKTCRQELQDIIGKMATKEARDAAKRKYRQFLAGKGWPTSRDVQDTWELSEGESSSAATEKEAPKETGAAKARARSASSASKSPSRNKPSPKKAKKK